MGDDFRQITMDRRKVLIIAAVIIIIVIIILAFGLKDKTKSTPITLEFWSVYDDYNVYAEQIQAYQEKNKYITINYQKKSFDNYEKELINHLAAGTGPDIFSIHNTWLPKHQDKLVSMPQTEDFFDLKTFKNTFVDVVYNDFVDNNKIYAIPFYVDTLALYYNRDFFNSAGIPSAPTIWEEFLDDVEKLTNKDKWGNIERGGTALGVAKNINRSTDILALLMLQTGAKMVDDDYAGAMFNQRTYLEGESFSPGEEALRFFTDFSNPIKRVYCWNRQMPYSIDAFYQGKVATMINYSHHIDTIKNKSPYLNFDIAAVPQIKDREFDITYANYWAQAVSKNSKHSEEAWKFLVFLTQSNNFKNYLEKAKRPTARRDLVEWQKSTDLGVFASQALLARSWYQIDNKAIETIFADMIESVVLGAATVKQAINKAADQVTILMK